MTPYKLHPDERELPTGIEDPVNSYGNLFFDQSEKKGIHIIDMRDLLMQEEGNWYSAFFKTDHHWKPETGLWAAQHIMRTLEENGVAVDCGLLADESMDSITYDDIFLGSQGKKIGRFWAGKDSFSLITPNYDTEFIVSQPLKNEHLEGSFEETLLQKDNLTYTKPYTTDVYSTYTGGNFALQTIKNVNSDNAKILVIRDSYGQTTTPFMALGCGELHTIDIRWSERIESVQKYIEDFDPDAVVILYTIDTINNPKAFEFN